MFILYTNAKSGLRNKTNNGRKWKALIVDDFYNRYPSFLTTRLLSANKIIKFKIELFSYHPKAVGTAR